MVSVFVGTFQPVADSVKVYDKDGNLMTATAAGTYTSQPTTVKYDYNTGYKDVLMDVTLTGSGANPDPGYNGPTSNKDGGGCDAGLGLAGLLAVAGLIAARKH